MERSYYKAQDGALTQYAVVVVVLYMHNMACAYVTAVSLCYV